MLFVHLFSFHHLGVYVDVFLIMGSRLPGGLCSTCGQESPTAEMYSLPLDHCQEPCDLYIAWSPHKVVSWTLHEAECHPKSTRGSERRGGVQRRLRKYGLSGVYRLSPPLTILFSNMSWRLTPLEKHADWLLPRRGLETRIATMIYT